MNMNFDDDEDFEEITPEMAQDLLRQAEDAPDPYWVNIVCSRMKNGGMWDHRSTLGSTLSLFDTLVRAAREDVPNGQLTASNPDDSNTIWAEYRNGEELVLRVVAARTALMYNFYPVDASKMIH